MQEQGYGFRDRAGTPAYKKVPMEGDPGGKIFTSYAKYLIQERGPGFWRLNCSLLKDQKYVDLINNTIPETAQNNPDTDDILLWDTIKLKVRGDSIRYSSP